MNERVMQFRIGMFVIVAGLVLTMLIIWFGESPSLFQDRSYLTIHYPEAPGVNVGIPVRKSGIRVGEVAAVEFDDPEHPDGVLVTLALERKYSIKAGAIPRIGRALIGDVSIDLMPSTSAEPLKTYATPELAIAARPHIEGALAPDPSNALVVATATLETINQAAAEIAVVAEKAQGIDELLVSWRGAGDRLGAASEDISRVVRDNEENLKPAIVSIREFADRASSALDQETTESFKRAIAKIDSAAVRLDQGLAEIQPLLRDLGSDAGERPQTNTGWSVYRLNRSLSEIGLLTQTLATPDGRLSTEGSLQRLTTRPDLHDNLNRMSLQVADFFSGGRLLLRSFNTFAEKIAKDPSAISRGMLRPQ